MKVHDIIFVLSVFLTLTVGVVPILIPALQDVYRLYKESRIPFREDPWLENKPILDEYDFIVIGSGPGGATVANRLTEERGWKVLVLEAGKDGSIYTDIPALVSYLQFTDYNWGFKAERVPGNCLGMSDERCRWPRGKGVGGTSLINYMIYTRGNPEDYNSYAADGNTGWSYDEILPYFLKAEKNNIPEYQNSPYHNQSGYLTVERVTHKTPLVEKFLEAGREIGIETGDYTAPSMNPVFSRIQATMKSGRRMSAARAYLETIKYRQNLHVVEKARVTKILIDPQTRKTIGVEFVKNRKRRCVYAKKEVILAAGALQSPHLLMLSGIGPRNHLEEKNVSAILDLPGVGENMHEHWTTPSLIFLHNMTGASITERRVLNPLVIKSWLNGGRGLLSLSGGVEGIAYTNTPLKSPGEYPDMEYIFNAGGIASDSGNTVRKGIGISDELYEDVFRCIDNKDVWSIWPMLLRPKSRGKVLLKDNNPWHWPLFYHDYFQDPEDARRMVEGMKMIVALSQTKAFQSIGSRLHSVPIPACASLGFGTDEYFLCSLRHLTVTLHHQSGTCKMGPSSDPMAVVDPQLKVHGISGLRVVDASIFPRLPSAHLYAPTVMVGEKAADMIKEQWLSTVNNEV
ncbi:glucose dehydrogenase [FAD, quinone]-like [Nilaparvata lugens]|uniref:glucose dehydrogenase [FAD, quinone]-like n=1 Tax=Nilaparvata lugens TaxID=108931 RepID=UPI00193E1876|nr:glucose dehydrogenase [FAD, quinone]-like [Nilaparvata lugens]